jgi:hypothetical protein
MKKCWVDCETTGLEAGRHELWEIAIIERFDDGSERHGIWCWLPDLTTASPDAMRVNGFYDRMGRVSLAAVLYHAPSPDGSGTTPTPTHPGREWTVSNHAQAAREIAGRLAGAVMIGNVPSFDAGFLRPWLTKHGQVFAPHYQLVGVEALVAGYLRASEPEADSEPPWNSRDLADMMGVTNSAPHTAYGDARAAKDIYDVVFPRPSIWTEQ